LIALLNSRLKKLIIFSNVIFKREFSRAGKGSFSYKAIMLNSTEQRAKTIKKAHARFATAI